MLSDGLWRRASAAGALTPLEKRAFGIADDMQVFLFFFLQQKRTPKFTCTSLNSYGAGLLVAYMAFIPFCEAGIMDGISLQVIEDILTSCSLGGILFSNFPLRHLT